MRKLVFYFSFLFAIFSCNKSGEYSGTQESVKDRHPLSVERLDKNKKYLSSDDASLLVKLYNSQMTKAPVSDIEIKNTVPICAGDSVVMWAVNLAKGGYVICSAKKSYYPIIADVQYGEYDSETIEDTALEFYLKMVAEDARYADNIGNDPEIGLLWHKYENRGDVSLNTKSSTDYTVGYYYDFLYDNYYDSWVERGYNVYFLRQYPKDMPAELYESFCATAEDVFADVPGYPYMDCCIILEKISSRNTGVGPLIQTHWDQGEPYNNSDEQGRALGCVTIAVAQIMKYHEHPDKYSWSQMPNTLSDYIVGTTVLSDFLYHLRKKLWVTNDGASSIEIASAFLSTNGYHTSRSTHSESNVYSSLYKKNPVYMRGMKVGEQEGHAWVCDGYITFYEYKEYKLMVPSIYNGEIYGFEPFRDFNEPTYSFTTYHMNWGWGGDHDGYYITPNTDNGNFSEDWKDMIVYPK